jgi:hypothetical protein
MSNTFNASMFESIKDALVKNTGGTYNEIMKTTPGNTYTVRLLPYGPDPKNTFFHHYNQGWTSFATGEYVQALSPTTFGERDPISEARFKSLRVGTDEEKEKANTIRRMEKWLVNVYVIEDQSNPENNGKVKLLRYGKQLHKIITEAIEGEEAEEFGPRIFDLGSEGVNFKIKCEQQGDYPTYVSSRFTTAGKLDLAEDKQKEIYDSVHDLTKVFTLKSYDELTKMLNDHYYVGDVPEASTTHVEPAPVNPVQPSTPVAEPVSNTQSAVSVDDDIDIDELLKDL